MSYKQCIHYNEILFFLSESKDLEYVSFNLEDIQDCKDENCVESGVCSLWISLTLVGNLRPQLSLAEAELTIENLDEQLKVIATELVLHSPSRCAKCSLDNFGRRPILTNKMLK